MYILLTLLLNKFGRPPSLCNWLDLFLQDEIGMQRKHEYRKFQGALK